MSTFRTVITIRLAAVAAAAALPPPHPSTTTTTINTFGFYFNIKNFYV